MKLEQLNDLNRTPSTDDINNFFDDTYSKVYSELLNIELTSQVNFLENNYLKDNKKILDLCCGTGRHIKELSDKGYMVDGIDINPEAVHAAQKNQVSGKIYLSDVQSFKTNVKYDLIYSMESSIGYLSDEETINIFKNISKNLLANDGSFILHLTNKDYLIKNLNQRVWFGNPTTGYLLEDRVFDVEKGTLEINQIRIIDAIDKEYSIRLRLYSLNELKYLLNEAGLSVIKVYGNYDNENYSINSPYTIVECSKINN